MRISRRVFYIYKAKLDLITVNYTDLSVQKFLSSQATLISAG